MMFPSSRSSIILAISPMLLLFPFENGIEHYKNQEECQELAINLDNNCLYLTENVPSILADRITSSYLQKTLLDNFPDDLTLPEAREIQNLLLQRLMPHFGSLVGYKAALTNEAAQKQFNVSQPVQGYLLEKMLLKSGAVVPANFAARPMLEGDLLVRVGSESINSAKTHQEVLAGLDAVIPFLELPDLLYAPSVKLDGVKIVAINVGARLGIMGEAVAIKPTGEWQEKLSNIQVIILAEENQPIAVGSSKALLNDPLQVVLWLRDNLQEQGISLKPGDLLSLGSITPLIPVRAHTNIRAQYWGINKDSPMEISLQFVRPR